MKTLTDDLRDWRAERPDEWTMDRFIEKAEQQDINLKLAYCKDRGADSVVGLDCCDDYRDWLAALDA